MTKLFFLISTLFIYQFLFAQEKPEGLFINSKAPDFKAIDQYGKEVRLKDVLKDSLVVLVFYRGEWSPYCIKFIRTLEDSLQLIKDKGARLIAITPEKPGYISKTIEKTKASFPLIYDKEMKIMKAYAVAFEVDDRTVSRYKNADIDLATANGQKEKIYLPVPAVYIISKKEGTIVYRYFEFDYKKRVSVQEILNNLN
ncbi:MAG TPA: peroxiredoxin-like family protein [Chitinophagaceae bacterium]|nr:peroxiredoxin-like family protein [Chitinophagaceae bacterium]